MDLPIPHAHEDQPLLARLGGHSLGALMDAERRATAAALAAHKRPSMTITLDRCDAWHLGGLVLMMELAAIYAGALYGVDPLDQPAVELGKRMAVNELERQALVIERTTTAGLRRDSDGCLRHSPAAIPGARTVIFPA